jgi:hypothetical protein
MDYQNGLRVPRKRGLSWMVDELPPHDPYAGEPDCLGASVGRGGLGANLVSKGCGILSIAQVARSFPATAPLPVVGIHWATQALGGRVGTPPRRHPEAGGGHHPVPGHGQQLPELPVPLFLGHLHLAMLIFARHSVANQAGFASPHPRISALRSTI